MLTVLPAIRGVWDDGGVAQNFVVVDREQLWLMPPSVDDWLPPDHLARFVVDVVDEFDLDAFVARYRDDGRGGAAYPPRMMVALLVYAYSLGELSSRRIQRQCVENVAFRFVAANLLPDHATIARFRATHEVALAGLFGQVLALCAKAGMIRPGLLAVDGTKIKANASKARNRTAEQLADDIVKAAGETDAAEDVEFGDDNGNELPEELRGPSRKRYLRKLLDELRADQAANSFDEYLARRAAQEAATGKRLPGRAPSREAWERKHHGRQQANTTDPESRTIKERGGFVQGFNAQAVVTEDQVVVAAEVTNDGSDFKLLQPMVKHAKKNLRKAGVKKRARTVLADAGYFSADNANMRGIEPLIAPGQTRHLRDVSEDEAERDQILKQVEAGEIDAGQAAELLGLARGTVVDLLKRRRRGVPQSQTAAMIAKLDAPRGKRLYKKRSASVEPVFAQIKHNRKFRTFSRRGLAAVDSEWKLMTATHNLLKLWRTSLAAT